MNVSEWNEFNEEKNSKDFAKTSSVLHPNELLVSIFNPDWLSSFFTKRLNNEWISLLCSLLLKVLWQKRQPEMCFLSL